MLKLLMEIAAREVKRKKERKPRRDPLYDRYRKVGTNEMHARCPQCWNIVPINTKGGELRLHHWVETKLGKNKTSHRRIPCPYGRK